MALQHPLSGPTGGAEPGRGDDGGGHRVRVKICGVTRPGDAQLAEAAGADAIGLIFAAHSSRRVTMPQALEIGRALGSWITRVGVFTGGDDEEILAAVAAARLDVVQLHGEASPERVARLARSVRVVRALPYVPGLEPEAVLVPGVDGVLLDGPRPGSGRPFTWASASAWRGHPRLLLAGGLTPETVAEAVATLRPYGVDVASGVESAPGIKDAGAVRRFVHAARTASSAPR